MQNSNIFVLPLDLFQSYIHILSKAIGSEANFYRLSDILFANKLITQSVYLDVTTTPRPIYEKGSKVVHELYGLIQSSKKPEQTLQKICIVLQDTDDQTIKESAKEIMHQLNQDLPEQPLVKDELESHQSIGKYDNPFLIMLSNNKDQVWTDSTSLCGSSGHHLHSATSLNAITSQTQNGVGSIKGCIITPKYIEMYALLFC